MTRSKFAAPPATHRVRVRIPRLCNLTTRMEIRDGKRIFAGTEDKSLQAKIVLEFLELTEKSIRLSIPSRTCAQGHRLELDIELIAPDERIDFQGEGKVESVEASNNSHDLVTIALSNHASEKWTEIKRHFFKRQSSVADLFEKLKGSAS